MIIETVEFFRGWLMNSIWLVWKFYTIGPKHLTIHHCKIVKIYTLALDISIDTYIDGNQKKISCNLYLFDIIVT